VVEGALYDKASEIQIDFLGLSLTYQNGEFTMRRSAYPNACAKLSTSYCSNTG
jgi:hypothetical protein